MGLSPKPDFLERSASAAALRLNFRGEPLRSVLSYLRDAANLTIEVESNVEVNDTIDLWNDRPLNKQDALRQLKHALNEKGYVGLHKGALLSIIRKQDAKKHYIPLPELSFAAAV